MDINTEFPVAMYGSVFMPLRLSLVLRSLILVFAALVPGRLAAADVPAPGFHFLAADPSLRAGMQDVAPVMGQATYVGEVLEVDQPWEADYGYLVSPGSTVIDPVTGQWRMYYELMSTTKFDQRIAAMATSTDGVHWTKPELNATGTEYTTDPRNNFIDHASQNWLVAPHVFVDPRAPAAQRYRMTELGVVDNRPVLCADASADGIHFHRAGIIDDSPNALDTQNNVFWDPRTNQYIAEMRYKYPAVDGLPVRRGVFTRASDVFDTTWTSPEQYTIDPKDVPGIGPGAADIYTPCIVPYKGQYIGLPTMFYHYYNVGPVYPTFMYSRDNVDWHFSDPYHPIIDLTAHGQTEITFGQAYTQTSLLEKDGELYIYYSYMSDQHDHAPNPAANQGTIHLAKLPEDRFVGIQSPPGVSGVWTTSPITIPDDPGHLIVNALVGGSIRVEVLDPDTSLALEGFSLTDMSPILSGDFLNASVQWHGMDNLNALSGETVLLRFIMDDATVYSFHFVTAREPSAFFLSVIGFFSLSVARIWRKRR